MNSQERFLATMAFEPVDRPPFWEMGYWADTLRQWYQQGLPTEAGIPDSIPGGETIRGEFLGPVPDEITEVDVHRYLDFDQGLERIPVNNFVFPEFVPTLLEDHDTWILYRDKWGIIARETKSHSSLPSFIQGPVANLEDFQQFASERLNPNLTPRLPEDWPAYLERARNRDFPLAIGGKHGFYGTPRFLLGDTQLLYAFYDKPELIKTINSYLTDFWIELYDQILKQVKPDMALIWEDMCYKNGPLISPGMFEEFILPYYLKLTGFFHDHGIEIILVDTDGDCRSLIPLFIQGGITGFYPLEATGGMDIVTIGSEFPKIQLIGGLDKKAIIKGEDAIDFELGTKVPNLVRRGGYIPTADHLIPPGVSWSDFLYYRRRIATLINSSHSLHN
jgi:hypothetical protein